MKDIIIFAGEDMDEWDSLGFFETGISYNGKQPTLENHFTESRVKLLLHDDGSLDIMQNGNEVTLNDVNLCFVADLIEVLARQ